MRVDVQWRSFAFTRLRFKFAQRPDRCVCVRERESERSSKEKERAGAKTAALLIFCCVASSFAFIKNLKRPARENFSFCFLSLLHIVYNHAQLVLLVV